MAATCSKFSLAFLVLAVWPVSVSYISALRDDGGIAGDVHSLQCDFSITFNERPRCMVQAFMGTVDVLLYDCDNNEVMAVNDKLKGTKTLEDMKHTLKDMGDLMREKLLDIKAETKRAPPTLQVGLMCWCNASGSCSGSSGFGFGGQRFPVFDSASGKYIADNSGDKGMKENLEQDKEVTIAFQVTFLGNCKEWLTALVDRERELETRAAPTVAPAPAMSPTVSATPATTTATAQSKAMSTMFAPVIIPVILTCLIILDCVPL